MVSGDLAGECPQTGFEKHGSPPQRAPVDTVYPLRDHLNNVQPMVSGEYCEGLFPDAVCWTRLRNTWNDFEKNGLSGPMRDTPPYRATPEIVSQEGGIAPICLAFIGLSRKYR